MENRYGEVISFRFRWLKALKRRKPAMAGLAWISLITLCALAGYAITPDASPKADYQMPEVALQPPGFHSTVLSVANAPDSPRGFFQKLWYGMPESSVKMAVNRVEWKGDSLLAWPFAGFDPSTGTRLSGSIKRFHRVEINGIQERTWWLGTDNYGRCLLSRLIIGSRVSLGVALMAVFVALVIGVPIGAAAGYFGGRTDDLALYAINVVWSIPTILLVFAVVMALGRGIGIIFFAVGLTMWVEVARLVRGQVLFLRHLAFVEAAKSMGFCHFRILFRHILPNITGPLLVVTASVFSTAILIESGLSFLGFGIQPPVPSWGNILNENYGYAIGGKPFVAILPAAMILLTVLAFNLLGNGLRDASEAGS